MCRVQPYLGLSCSARLQANDEISLIGFQNSGGSLSSVGAPLLVNDFASLAVQWLGP